MSTMQLDWRTGEPYIDPTGSTPWLEEAEAAAQSFRNILGTWKGSDLDVPNFGVDWAKIFRMGGSDDPTPVLIMELTDALSPKNDYRIDHISGIYVEDGEQDNRRFYTVHAQIVTTFNKSITMEQKVAP